MSNQRPAPTKYQPPNKTYLLPADAPGAPGRPAADPRDLRRRRKRRTFGTAVLASLLAVIVAFVAVVLLLPGCIKQKAIDAAAEHGVTLTIDDVNLAPSHFTLVGVTAKLAEMPGFEATAKEVQVDLSGLDPQLVTVKKAEMTLDGPYDVAKASYAKWRTAHKPAQPLPKIVFEGAHVKWTRPIGVGTLEAFDARAEIVPPKPDAKKGATEDVHVMAPLVKYTVPTGTLGPWRVDYDREGMAARIRVAFDPQVPETPNAILVTDLDTITQVDVTMPRAPLARINVPPEMLGLPKDDKTQIEAKIRYVHPTPAVVESTAAVGIYGMHFVGVPIPLDAKLDTTIKGDSKSVLDIKKGEMQLGNLKGALTGALKLYDDGFRIDLAWKAGPMDCATFFQPAAGSTDPSAELARALAELAQSTGVAKVTGEIKVDAALLLDTRDLTKTKLTFLPTQSCNVKVF